MQLSPFASQARAGEMGINWARIAEALIIASALGGVGWLVDTLRKARKDLDAAFYKIRALQKEIDHELTRK